MRGRADGSPALTAPDLPTFRERTTVEVQESVDVAVPSDTTVVVDGVEQRWNAGAHAVDAGSTLVFAAGSDVPHVERLDPLADAAWALPLNATDQRDHPLYATYSLVLALFFGTMGLPHVLVRFYTNPDGGAARRTTLVVLCLLGVFYLWPTLYGVLGRVYAPDLLLTGRTDAVVLVLPGRMIEGLGGDLLGALVTGGAFAAFLSTSSGLAVSVAGVLSQDVLRGQVRDFRIATFLAVVIPLFLALAASSLAVADVVGLAFAVAASSFCPLLVLGIWWRRLTWVGAAAGLVAGGGLAIAAVATTIARGGIAAAGCGALLAHRRVDGAHSLCCHDRRFAGHARPHRAQRRTHHGPAARPESLDLDRDDMPDRTSRCCAPPGINVRKAKRIAMADLRDAVGSLGHTEVKTRLTAATSCSPPPTHRPRKPCTKR